MPSGEVLIDSYHCSRYNQNTGRLTPEMFEAVFARAIALGGQASKASRSRRRHRQWTAPSFEGRHRPR